MCLGVLAGMCNVHPLDGIDAMARNRLYMCYSVHLCEGSVVESLDKDHEYLSGQSVQLLIGGMTCDFTR